MLKRRYRIVMWVLMITILGVIGLIMATTTHWLDPGDKGDVTTDLVTPTPAVDNGHVFDVSAAESQVDFVTRIYGLELHGVFPVTEGTITLEPVGDQLRVLVRLHIHVDAVKTGNVQVDDLLRGVMETGDYPLAFYVASSREFVPVTQEIITFVLDGNLQVHNVAQPHTMTVTAQLVDGDMWAVATSELNLAQHDVEIPAFVGSATIELTARLQAYRVGSPEISGVSGVAD